MIAVCVVVLAACQELPRYFVGDTPLARVDKRELKMSDVESVVPQGVTGKDSAAFMKVYIDRWVRKQLKLREAEILFSESEADIDRMVEEYRQTLLIRKLDRQNIDRNIDTTFSAKEIETYYDTHKADFRLDRTLVKGRVVRFNEGYRQTLKLKTLMASQSSSQQKDFTDLCAKNEFTITDMRDHWVDFTEFLSYLPTPRKQNHDSILASTAVQEMSDSHSHYYLQIDSVRREGEPIPIERLRSTIRRILYNQRQGEINRHYEEELYEKALLEGDIKIYSAEEGELIAPQKEGIITPQKSAPTKKEGETIESSNEEVSPKDSLIQSTQGETAQEEGKTPSKEEGAK